MRTILRDEKIYFALNSEGSFMATSLCSRPGESQDPMAVGKSEEREKPGERIYPSKTHLHTSSVV